MATVYKLQVIKISDLKSKNLFQKFKTNLYNFHRSFYKTRTKKNNKLIISKQVKSLHIRNRALPLSIF